MLTSGGEQELLKQTHTRTCLHNSKYKGNLIYLGVLAILDILLSVEKPVRDFVLTRVLHYGYNSLHLPVQTKKKCVNVRWLWHL